MANVNASTGFEPLQGRGGKWNGELERVYISQSDSTKIFTGDLVKINTAAGTVSQWTNGTAVSQCKGVFWGCQYLSTSLGRVMFNNYWPGTDVASGVIVEGFVIPLIQADSMLFRIQSDSSTARTAADIGKNFDITVGTGSTATGKSASVIQSSSLATTATLPFTVVDLWGKDSNGLGRGNVGPGTDSASGYQWFIVAFNGIQRTGI